MNELNLSPNITYYLNNSSNRSLIDIIPFNDLNDSLMNNEGAEHPKDDGHDDQPQPETPKMNINFNSNNQKLNENINHEHPQKEDNINTKTKATTNKVKIIPTIQNIVYTAKLNWKLRLREIAFQEQIQNMNQKDSQALLWE